MRAWCQRCPSPVWAWPDGSAPRNKSSASHIQRAEKGYSAEEWVALGSFVQHANRGGGTVFIFLAHSARWVAEPTAGDPEDLQVELIALGNVAILASAAQMSEVMYEHH